MKSFRWTWLFAVVVLGLVIFSVHDFKTSEKEEAQKEKDQKVVSIPMEETTKLELKTNGQPDIVLEKKDDVWRELKPIADQADPDTMTAFLLSLSNEKVQQTVVEADDINLATYGLDHPVKELITTGKSGTSSDVKIGSVKAYDGNLYAQIGKNKVALVSSSWDAHLAKTGESFRDKHLLRSDLKFADVKAIEIERVGYPSLRAVRDGTSWKLTKGGFDVPVLPAHVEGYFDEIKNARLQDFTSPDKAKDYVKAGLAHPELQVRLFKAGDQPVLGLQFAKPPNTKPEKGHPPLTAAISSDLPDLLSVQKSTMESLAKDANYFYDRKLAFQFNSSDVAMIDVDTTGVKNVFKKTGDAWVPEKPVADRTVDSLKITNAIEHLSHIEPIRILAPLNSPMAKEKLANAISKITLKKADGSELFMIQWGAPMTESVNGVEARYLPARTNRIDFLLGVTENELKSLGLGDWFKSPTATPVPRATPGGLGAKGDEAKHEQ